MKSLVIVGGGPAGYSAAFAAAKAGLAVTLVDKAPLLGGTCLHCGCIPSKALLHAARLLTETREAEAFGLHFARPDIRLDVLREWKENICRQLAGGLAQMAKMLKVDVRHATATFESPAAVMLHPADGDSAARLEFENLLLCTGSASILPPGFPARHPALWTSTEALDIPEIPESLLVVGGGQIGLELGTVYAALGSKVTVVEMSSGLLPGADRDLLVHVSRRLRGLFSAIHLQTCVEGFEDAAGGGIQAILRHLKTDEVRREVFSKVLVAVGRRPATAELNVAAAGIQTTPQGFIRTETDDGQTSVPGIYAVGDVAGNPMLAHKAIHEARQFVARRMGGAAAAPSPCIPSVSFTDPEVAWCGLTETEAKQKAIPVAVGKWHWAANGRACTLGRTDGVTKLLADPSTGRLLGAGIAGAGAAELISEMVLALEAGLNIKDVARAIHPHPTLSETLWEASGSVLAKLNLL